MSADTRPLLIRGTVTSALCSILLAIPAAAQEQPEEALALARVEETGKAFTAIAKLAMPAVVFIQVEKVIASPHRRHSGGHNDPYGFFGDEFLQRFFGQQGMPPREFKQEAAGSGFIITKDGYILTNSHVVGDADRIRVKLHDGRAVDATLVGADEKSEVAVIKVDLDDLPTVPLGSSAQLEIGEWVVAIGNPFGLTETLTAGVVSAVGRNNIGIADYENFIQTDAAINPGNSGGPLLNIRGEVIGINTAIYSRSGGYMGIGFAIPIDMARNIQQQLMSSGKVERGYLGVFIQEMDEHLASAFELTDGKGILIADVEPDSPAAKGGLRVNDVIISLNGQKITDVGSFRNQISSFAPETEIKLSITRGGKLKRLTVAIGSLPGQGDPAGSAADALQEKIGLAVSDITDELASRLGVEAGTAVVIMQIAPSSPAGRAGLTPGMVITSVNLTPVSSVEQFADALLSSEQSGRVVLRLRSGRHHRYMAFSLE
jgi:serine protease Do